MKNRKLTLFILFLLLFVLPHFVSEAFAFIFFGTVFTVGFIFLAISGSLYIYFKKLDKYINEVGFEYAKKNKPSWFILGNKLYEKVFKWAEENTTGPEEILLNKALKFYNFKSKEELSKKEIKKRWTAAQKIHHPDSGKKPNLEKSQSANEYKNILINFIN